MDRMAAPSHAFDPIPLSRLILKSLVGSGQLSTFAFTFVALVHLML